MKVFHDAVSFLIYLLLFHFEITSDEILTVLQLVIFTTVKPVAGVPQKTSTIIAGSHHHEDLKKTIEKYDKERKRCGINLLDPSVHEIVRDRELMQRVRDADANCSLDTLESLETLVWLANAAFLVPGGEREVTSFVWDAEVRNIIIFLLLFAEII